MYTNTILPLPMNYKDVYIALSNQNKPIREISHHSIKLVPLNRARAQSKGLYGFKYSFSLTIQLQSYVGSIEFKQVDNDNSRIVMFLELL